MRSLLLGIVALGLAVSGTGLSQVSKAQASHGTGNVHGQIWMNDEECDIKMRPSDECEAVDVHDQFTIFVKKWSDGKWVTLAMHPRVLTDNQGMYSVDLAPGTYRFGSGTNHPYKFYNKKTLFGIWTGNVVVTEDSSQEVNIFHYLEHL